MREEVLSTGCIRFNRMTTVSAFSVLALAIGNCLSPNATAVERSTQLLASRLVAQLGHEQFAKREQAAAGIIELRLDAETALRAGLTSQNREVRYRCGKLLGTVLELDLEHRFEQFKRASDPDQDYGLPGWDAYREIVGDSPTARAIFVSMHQDEASLLAKSIESSSQLSRALSNRCDEIAAGSMFGRVEVGLGTSATLLFAATRDGIEVSPVVPRVIYMACSDRSFATAIESNAGREVLAKLSERWIDRHPLDSITYALHLGLAYEFEGVLSRARDVFESPVNSVMDRIYACRCVAKFGDKSDIARLERYLEDVNICGQTQVDGQVVVTEMRDVALAALVHLTGQDPIKFGFDRYVKDQLLVFDVASLGFRDEQSRIEANGTWQEYRLRTVDTE